MPTRTRPTTYRCTRHGAVEVEGSTGRRYTVQFTNHGTACSCPGYTYHRHCRHQRIGERLRCPWTSGSPTLQTTPGTCPECGAATTPPAAPPLDSRALFRAVVLALIENGAGAIVLFDDAVEIEGPGDVLLAAWTGHYTRAQLARVLNVPQHVIKVNG